MAGGTLLLFRNVPVIVYCIYLLFIWWHCSWLNYGVRLLDDGGLEVVVGVRLESSKKNHERRQSG